MSPLVASRIRTAIEWKLQAKGIAYNNDVPDLLIDYNLTVESRLTSSNVGTTVGCGWGGYGHCGGAVISTAPDIRQYDQGTLYVDFCTAADDALVWRARDDAALTNCIRGCAYGNRRCARRAEA